MRAALVTGSRHWQDSRPIGDALDSFAPDLVIEGCAPGADAIARTWALERGIGLLSWPDNHWGGPAHVTGPIRNGYMVQVAAALAAAGWQVTVHAFPDAQSRGTWSCVDQAKAAGLQVTVHARWPLRLRLWWRRLGGGSDA